MYRLNNSALNLSWLKSKWTHSTTSKSSLRSNRCRHRLQTPLKQQIAEVKRAKGEQTDKEGRHSHL